MEGYPPIQVIVPPAPKAQDAEVKMLSFGEALQYTPFVASMLPVHDRIPIPQICRPKESAKMTTSAERKHIQHTLEQMPAEKVKLKLDSLLRTDNLAEIKFRRTPVTGLSNNVQEPSEKIKEYKVSAIAQMVLDLSKIDYRYPSVSSAIKADPSLSEQYQQPILPTPSPTTPVTGSGTAMLQSTQVSTESPTKTYIHTPSSRPLLVNSPLPPGSQGQVKTPESVRRQDSAHGADASNITSVHVRSQREASDASLLNFQNDLMEIFEAQDQLDAGASNAQNTGFFDQLEDGDDSEPKLSLKTLEQLQLSLKKLIRLKRISDVSVEHLRRLQRLCEPAIEKAQMLSVCPPKNHHAEDLEHWNREMYNTEVGLASSSVCLHIVLGNPHEEGILLTDAKNWIPNVLTNVFDSCLIPVVEARQDGQNAEIFEVAFGSRDVIKHLLESSKKLLDLISTVCTEVIGMDSCVHMIEFLCAKLIFVQNASNDKSSCLGIQVYEKARKIAMSCLAKIYARYPKERTTITDEVLSSLDKLPSNSRAARQYRLGNGKTIQLISALFMHLAQTTALEMPEHGQKPKRKNAKHAISQVKTSDDEDDEPSLPDEDEIDDTYAGPLARLGNKANRLFDTSARGAHDIIMYLVTRASKTFKTGDSPYRNVFDLFIEDLVAVLPEPEWPSSELMLRILAKKMIDLAKNDRAASTKNMALESLGLMGSAISAQKTLVPSLAAALERDGRQKSDVTTRLCDLVRDYESGALRAEDLIAINGPFAVVSRQLWSDAGQNLRLRSACGYFLAHFAKLVSRSSQLDAVDERDIESQPIQVSNWLLELIPNVGSDAVNTYHFDPVHSEEAELAYALCILNTGFCTFFGDIVKTLASSLSSDQAQVRSRSLKSVVAMLETDSSLLDRDHTIADDVFKCASDDSALVRDSALSLIARFIISKPGLEQKGIKRLLECASDSKVGVQKRAIGHLKDVYMTDSRELLRSKISSTFLERTADLEDSVAELAKKTLTDIWIHDTVPRLSDPSESKHEVAVTSLAMEIVRCVSYDTAERCILLQKFLVAVLAREPKNGGVRKLCSEIVDVLFEKTISGAEEQGPLHALAAFAAASSQLIQPERLAKLQSYLGFVKNEGDMFMLRSVIGIYSNVLPDLSATQKPLLAEIQGSLMKAVPLLGRRTELDPVMMCLRTIDGVLKNTLKLVKFAASVLKNIKKLQDDPAQVGKVARLLKIGGSIGRCLDLEGYANVFKEELKDFGNGTVAEYMAGVFHALTQPRRTFEIRSLAFESLGSVCQASPVLFNKSQIRTSLFSVLKNKSGQELSSEQEQLQMIVLRLFDDLYGERAQAKEDSDKANGDKEQQELGKLGGDSKTRDGDSAISIITREVVNNVLEIALSTQGDNTFLAVRTLASISHEGLIHPKQSTGAFVALGTSPDPRISNVAYSAHQLLHQTHESVCQREYMQAVQKAFDYQKDVVADACGARPVTFAAKLADCFKIVNTSNAKYVRSFLSGLVSRIASDLTSHDTESYTVDQTLLARFILQNLAFFEYAKMEELLHTILQLELAYSKSGGEIVQMLENNLPTLESEGPPHETLPADDTVMQERARRSPTLGDLQAVKRLAPLAATLLLLIETRSYLIRQYAVGQDVRAAISSNKQSKDTTKAPQKVYGITGERVWTRTNAIVASLDTDQGIITCCRSFIAQMSIDENVEVEVNGMHPDITTTMRLGEGDNVARAGTPSARKRKGSASANNTPVKRMRGRSRKEARRSSSASSVDMSGADDEE